MRAGCSHPLRGVSAAARLRRRCARRAPLDVEAGRSLDPQWPGRRRARVLRRRGDAAGRGRRRRRAPGGVARRAHARAVAGRRCRRRHPARIAGAGPDGRIPDWTTWWGPDALGRAGPRRRPARGRSGRTGTAARRLLRRRRPGAGAAGPRTAPGTSSSRRPTTTRRPRRGARGWPVIGGPDGGAPATSRTDPGPASPDLLG